MKKKNHILLGIAIVLLLCSILYFKPLSFSNFANEDNRIAVVVRELGVRNGEAYNDSNVYQESTAKQKRAILDILENFDYRRTIGTLFSNAYISDPGDKLLDFYVYNENNLLINTVMISSSGKLIINDKSYTMKNAGQLIEQVIDIME